MGQFVVRADLVPFFARRGAVIALSFVEPQSWATGMPAPLHFLVNGAARSMH